MTRLSRSIAAIAALVAAAPAVAAPATDGAAQGDITVTAPRVRQTGRSAIGAPIETVSVDAMVDYDDLNLATAAGRDELHARIQTAAEDSCAWLDEMYPLDAAGNSDRCVADAVDNASTQVDKVIATAS